MSDYYTVAQSVGLIAPLYFHTHSLAFTLGSKYSDIQHSSSFVHVHRFDQHWLKYQTLTRSQVCTCPSIMHKLRNCIQLPWRLEHAGGSIKTQCTDNVITSQVGVHSTHPEREAWSVTLVDMRISGQRNTARQVQDLTPI